ncbi:MAG: alpha/beta hydrolase-fold protein [Lacibacter sp.]
MLQSRDKIYGFILLVTGLLLCNILPAQHTVRIELSGRPDKHLNDTLYIAGSFNGWNPRFQPAAFTNTIDGKSVVELKNFPAGIIEFKITRGSWSTVEAAAKGSAITNRAYKIISDTLFTISVEAWTDDFPRRPPVSTRSKNVFIADTAFSIPQLNRKRRIWVYLPEEYVFNKKAYPVIYMQDGQNLFDVVTSSFGEWGVDELMDSIQVRKQCIIVGIDHGSDKRFTEYNPYSSVYGKGEGDAYVDFLVQTLKPYIDKTYRTKPQRESTIIAGSSMGGLISLYAVIKYPDVFGGAGVFSPAFWLAPELFAKANEAKKINAAVYFVCGEMESLQMTKDMDKMYQQLKQNGATKLFYRQVKDGMHNENFWRNELPAFYQWMYTNQIK